MNVRNEQGYPMLVGLAIKSGALCFLLLVAAIPVVIVSAAPGSGGIWVAGFVTGMVTVPFLALGVLRSLAEIAIWLDMDIFKGAVAYGLSITAISLAAALWSIFQA